MDEHGRAPGDARADTTAQEHMASNVFSVLVTTFEQQKIQLFFHVRYFVIMFIIHTWKRPYFIHIQSA